jgi:copper(I)-binding protein
MRMSAVDRLALPAGKAVKLEPGGYHVMLMGLVAPIKEGDTVAITLALKDKDGKPWSVDVKAPVRALAAAPAPKH